MIKNKKLKSLLIALTFVSSLLLSPIITNAQTYQGVDVYEYSNISNYQVLRNSGVDVLIQKASEGLYHNDSLLVYRSEQAQKFGFKIGYYHYADGYSAIGEAQHFISQVGKLHSDTCLWLDIENESNWSKNSAIDFTKTFINYVQSQGYKIGIYTGEYFYRDFLQNNIPKDIPLWLANYSSKAPIEFPTQSWQYSESGTPQGTSTLMDMDFFADNIFNTNVDIQAVNNEINQNTQIQQQNNLQNNILRGKKFVGSRCSELQEKLNKIGYSLIIDNDFGGQTYKNLIKFQSKNGLVADGLAGNATFSKLDFLIAQQNQVSSNSNVLALQKLCNQLGIKGANGRSLVEDEISGINTKSAVSKLSTCGLPYKQRLATQYIQRKLNIYADGIFGGQTRQAVMTWQRQHNLYPDGICGRQTWLSFLNN